jgi:hypothetical protein
VLAARNGRADALLLARRVSICSLIADRSEPLAE